MKKGIKKNGYDKIVKIISNPKFQKAIIETEKRMENEVLNMLLESLKPPVYQKELSNPPL